MYILKLEKDQIVPQDKNKTFENIKIKLAK